MAITQSFNGKTLRKPGAYSSLSTSLAGNLPVADTGIIGIIGEAAKGAPGDTSGVGVTTYDSAQLQDLIDNYGEGPIVDAARLLINPSNDVRITNGASRLYVWKTNSSTQATLTLATTWGTLTSANYGIKENLINATIAQDTAEDFVIVAAGAFANASGAATDLTFRINGGALITVAKAGLDNIANAKTNINSAINTALGTVAKAYCTGAAILQIDLDDAAISGSGAPRDGLRIHMEIINNDCSLLCGFTAPQMDVDLCAGETVTGLTAADATRSITINRQDDDLTEDTDDTTGELGGDCYLEIGYAGTTATVSVSATQLTTSVTGGSGASLTLTLADYATLNDLATYINAQTGYTSAVPSNVNKGLAPSVLGRVVTKGCCSTTAALKPGRIKADAYIVQNWFDNNSQLVTCVRTSYLGLPDVVAQTFLSGAALGSSATSDFTAGFTAFEAYRMNTVIPLLSQDGANDITEDATYTDSGSAYDATSTHTNAIAHCKKMSNTQNRSERNCYLGFRGTFDECKAQSLALNSEFSSMFFQDVYVVNASGELEYKQPHMGACLIAGLQAGSEVGEPATYKYVNAYGIKHLKTTGTVPGSTELFTPETMYNQAIDNGLSHFEVPPSGGVRLVLHNTTYSKDANFVYNRAHVLEAAHNVAYNLRVQLESTFTGTKSKTGTAQSIRNYVINSLETFLTSNIIVGTDDNDGLGWSNLTVTISGSTASIDVTIWPVQGIDFQLISITLDNIRQTA